MSCKSIVFASVTICLLVHAATSAQAAISVAGELIVDLRAVDASAASNVWANQATGGDSVGDFTAVNNADVQMIGGETGVLFDGSDGAIFRAGLAPATITGSSDRSIEVWAYNPSIGQHETMIAWAHRRGDGGSHMSFTFGSNNTHGAVGHWGAQDMRWLPAPTTGAWHHLVYVHGDGADTKLYIDGVPNYTENVVLNTLSTAGTFVNLGAQNADAAGALNAGERFTGYLANVRVHSGALTADDVLNNFNEGILDTVIPEPSSIVLLGTSLLGLVGLRRRRRRRS